MITLDLNLHFTPVYFRISTDFLIVLELMQSRVCYKLIHNLNKMLNLLMTSNQYLFLFHIQSKGLSVLYPTVCKETKHMYISHLVLHVSTY